MNDKKSNRSNNAVIAVISVLATLAVFAIGFVLFNVIDFDNIGGSRTRGTNDQYFYINQMNNVLIDSVHVTEDFVYVLSPDFDGEITVFDHDFNEDSIIRLRSERMIIGSFYMTDDAIYYSVGHEGELYRYDRETGMNQHLTSNVIRKTVVENQIFHLSGFWASNLYVFDKVTGETRVVFAGDVRQFSINMHDNTIIFMEDGSLYRIDFYGDNLEQLTDHNIRWDFTFDGETLAWSTFRDEIFTMDINTGEETHTAREFPFVDLLLTEDYFVFRDPTDLRIVNRNTNQSRQLVADVDNFAVVGDYIVYGLRFSRNLYVVDFYGNSRVLIEHEFANN